MGEHKRKQIKPKAKREFCNGCPHIRKNEWCTGRWRGYRFYCYKYFEGLENYIKSSMSIMGLMSIQKTAILPCKKCKEGKNEQP